MNEWFTVDRIDDDTVCISEYRHPEETHCYLLCGEQRCLLIDTGLGRAGRISGTGQQGIAAPRQRHRYLRRLGAMPVNTMQKTHRNDHFPVRFL